MRSLFRRRALATVAGACLSIAIAGQAGAITFGTVDTTNIYSNVGLLVAEYQGKLYGICSGTLISPTVFLTASHCTIGFDRVWVTFDVETGEDTVTSPNLLPGTAHTNPAYGGGEGDPHDVAVVALDSPAAGLTPAPIATANQLGSMSKTDLRAATFITAGYGEVRDAKSGGNKVLFYDGKRRYVSQTYMNLLPAWLDLSMQPSTGDGGTCYGDSGGPHFLNGVVVAITITGDAPCRATDKDYRIDTPAARDFLGDFVTLP